MQYTGEKCPVCGKVFTDGDDIVVCPTCGTPHHRKCYLQNKNCAHAADHAAGYVWAPQGAPGAAARAQKPSGILEKDGHRIAFCPVCGTENPAEEPNCTKCGARLYNNPSGQTPPQINLPDRTKQPFYAGSAVIAPAEKLGENTVGDTAEYIQRNAGRYIPKFFLMEKTGKKTSFNWAALLFGPHWFFYRRMYAVGAVLLTLLLALTGLSLTPRAVEKMQQVTAVMEQTVGQAEVSEETLQAYTDAVYAFEKLPETQIHLGLTFLTYLLCGIFANSAYKKHAERQVSRLKKESKSQAEYRLRLFKSGGVSMAMGLTSFLILAAGTQLITMLLLR